MNGAQEPSLQNKIQFLQAILWVLFVVFALRLFYLQVIQGPYYRLLSENNYTRPTVLRAPRGMLLDRNGAVLCRNQVSFSLVLDTAKGGSLDQTLLSMQRILGLVMTKEEVQAALRRSPVPSLAVLARDIPTAWMQKVEANQDELKMLRIEMELRREYPFGPVASHALGYVGLLSPEEAQKLRVSDNDPFIEVGKSGVERTANALLMGKNGLRMAQVNSLGREVEDPTLKLPGVGIRREPIPGQTVHLTLDIQLQNILEQAFGEEHGSAVFMNPYTGDILAWVSLPNFDPNLFSGAIPASKWRELSEDPSHPLLDRPIQGVYPPGSTFKPFVALVGLEDGVLTPGTTFFCPGYWEFGGRVFHCWAKGGHGTVDLLKGLEDSCDVYFYHAGDRIGIQRMDKWAKFFGLGTKTGVDLPSEISGIFPSPAWKAKRHLGPWYPGDNLPVAIGQGYLTVTPLQLLSIYATLATGGERFQPKLLEGPPKLESSVAISPQTEAVLKQALELVVESGTGTACRIPGVAVCAKTGTAQVVAASAGRNSMSLPKDQRDHAWFAGFAPAGNPSVAFVVMVEHGGHGGDLAAKIAKAGLEYILLGKKPAQPDEGTKAAPEGQAPNQETPPNPDAPLKARLNPQEPPRLITARYGGGTNPRGQP